VLTEEDKQWISKGFEKLRTEVEIGFSERLEKVETTVLTEFHNSTSPEGLRRRSRAAVLRALDAEVQFLSDRLKNLEGR
jgi:hypothetical protein